MIKSIFQAVAILFVCAFIAIAAGNGVGGGNKNTARPTPAPNGEAAAVQAVMDGMQPIIVSSAGAVDTLAEIADPTSGPTFFETWGRAGVLLCALGMILVAFVVVTIVLALIRSGVVMDLISKLE